MYEERFKKWNIRKYLKKPKKGDVLGLFLSAALSRSPPPDLGVGDDKFRKVIRYLQELDRTNMSHRKAKVSTSSAADSHDSTSRGISKISSQRDGRAGHQQLVVGNSPITSNFSHIVGPESAGNDLPSDVEQPLESSCSDRARYTSVTKFPPISSAPVSTRTSTPNRLGFPGNREDRATNTKDNRTTYAPAAGRWTTGSYSPLAQMPAHVSSQSMNMETILRNVYLSYAYRSLGHMNQHETSNKISHETEGPQAHYWNELKHGIYFLKVSSHRALPVLHKIKGKASAAFAENPFAFVQELFSALSPVNTSLCPGLRTALLRVFSYLTKEAFGIAHPLAILCDELQKDSRSQDISERVLFFIVDLLTSTPGSSCALEFNAQTTLIRYLRRSNNCEQAETRARRLLSNVSLSGVQSKEARKAARELEHVLRDQNRWEQALEVCFPIVGQSPADLKPINPQYHDEYAVHTMEDIAKIYDNLGDSKSCLGWLTQAAASAIAFGCPMVLTTHVIDKLERTKAQCRTKPDRQF